MFGGILHRMIFRELVKVFLLSLVGITGILLLAGIVAEASQQGLAPGQILAIIPLLIPSTLPYTIPATTLFATCVVYGRLAADNEILAIRASGINLLKVVSPGVVLGLATSLGTLVLYYEVIPYTHHLMRSMFLADMEELVYTMLRKNGQISYPQFDYSMYVRSVQGRRLANPIFKRRDSHGEIDVVAISREAELRVDMNKRVILVHMRDGQVLGRNGTIASFDDRIFDVPLPEDIDQKNARRPRDMTWSELFEEHEKLLDEEPELQEELRKTEELLARGKGGENHRLHAKQLKGKLRQVRAQLNAIVAEKQMRPALSLGCLFFVLVGCPVGIWFSRSDFLSSFITCFLPIVFIYYPLVLCGTSLVKSGKFPPVPTIWAADALMAFIGTILFWRLLRH
jgi:lipopolysaccharide export system permease protein